MDALSGLCPRTMKVADVVDTKLRMVSPWCTVQEAALIMAQASVECVLIKHGSAIVGGVTSKSIVASLASVSVDIRRAKVAELSIEPQWVYGDQPIQDLVDLFVEDGHKLVVVKDREEKVLGTVSETALPRLS